MRLRRLVGFFTLFAAMLLMGWNGDASAQERVLSFDAQLYVNEDASLLVTETIRIRAEGDIFKRGIVRSFPTVRIRPNSERRIKVGFDIVSVQRDGQPEPYHTESGYQTVDIYVGESDVFLQTGREYTYTLTYRTTKQIGFFDDFDELYWSVNGNGWALPFDRVSATVILPPSARDSVMQTAAYTGYFGDEGSDFRMSRTPEGYYRFETTRMLQPYEGLTVAVGWPIGHVARPTAEELAREQRWRESGFMVLRFGSLLILLYYAFFWFRVGVDPKRGTIIPLFTPPDHISPAAMRYVRRMGYDNKVFSASVLGAAVKGWLRIEIEKKKYTLYKITADAEKADLSDDERAVFKSLLGSRSEIDLDSKNHTTFSSAQGALKGILRGGHNKVHFNKNTGYIVLGVVLSVMVTLASLMLIALYADFSADDMAPLFILALLGFFVIPFQYLMIQIIKNAFNAPSWSTILGAVLVTLFLLPFGLGYFYVLFIFTWQISPLFFIGLALIFMVNLIFGMLMKAPTHEGRKLMDRIEGFRMFLKATEKERLEFLHPPAKTPELFERYLPYAVALDVENRWADQFSAVFAQLEQSGHEYRPTFYAGSIHHFNAARFSSDVGGRLAGNLASASAAPSSSGSSGSGGGGFSGGGGGGGGGGGW